MHLISWIAETGEIWLLMHALGQPLSLLDAFMLETLVSGARAAAFMVPAGLGVLEGSFVFFGALFGLPADTALAISLSKRVRELALGLPGLFVWHWMEGHYLMRRSAPKQVARVERAHDPVGRNCVVANVSTRAGSDARSSK